MFPRTTKWKATNHSTKKLLAAVERTTKVDTGVGMCQNYVYSKPAVRGNESFLESWDEDWLERNNTNFQLCNLDAIVCVQNLCSTTSLVCADAQSVTTETQQHRNLPTTRRAHLHMCTFQGRQEWPVEPLLKGVARGFGTLYCTVFTKLL